ncbi:hypothetical protein GCM10027046_31420 [Uliginosibacterium flavum]|uniref:ABC transporter substrate binding protein n=1 Tax=Uliginosibacterium flavum TaxID=1396831 RepID=A0ABV2TMW3_9RHOO
MAANIVVVLSEPAPAYQAYAQGFRASLEKRGSTIEIQILELSQLTNQPLPEASLLIAVGSRAAEALGTRNQHQPLLLAMLPRTNLDRLQSPQAKIGGVYIDQPAARYIALARAAIPDLEHIGLLVGRDSKDAAARLMAAARDARLRAQAETISSEADIYPAMQRLFADSGALLATPDTSVFNSQTIPSILLSAYRRGVPVIGFSPAYINAGAMVALYSTPEQLAAQSADISLQFLAGGSMPAPQYPRHYTIGINERVARSLGLSLEGEALIRERLERLERQP